MKIKTALVTGRHPFDLIGLHAIFKEIPEIDFYPQHTEDFITDTEKAYDKYDVIVFYNFHQETPDAKLSLFALEKRFYRHAEDSAASFLDTPG